MEIVVRDLGLDIAKLTKTGYPTVGGIYPILLSVVSPNYVRGRCALLWAITMSNN